MITAEEAKRQADLVKYGMLYSEYHQEIYALIKKESEQGKYSCEINITNKSWHKTKGEAEYLEKLAFMKHELSKLGYKILIKDEGEFDILYISWEFASVK